MKEIVFFVVKLILTILLFAILLGYLRNWQEAHSPLNKDFLSGKFPDPVPEGFLGGSASYTGSWIGKSFNADKATGINIFEEKGNKTEQYPFKVYKGTGEKDIRDVLKIDYDTDPNSFYTKYVLDELVQVSDGKYLGKIYLRIIPGSPFLVGFFRLEKS